MTNFSAPCPAIHDPAGACVHEEGCDWEMWTACAIDGLAVGDAIDFVACMDDSAPTDDNGKAEDVTEACADAKGLDFDAITACHDGDEGFKLLEAASERYLAAIADEPESFIPDFFINGVHQFPAYTYKTLAPAICAAGSTAAVCSLE